MSAHLGDLKLFRRLHRALVAPGSLGLGLHLRLRGRGMGHALAEPVGPLLPLLSTRFFQKCAARKPVLPSSWRQLSGPGHAKWLVCLFLVYRTKLVRNIVPLSDLRIAPDATLAVATSFIYHPSQNITYIMYQQVL